VNDQPKEPMKEEPGPAFSKQELEQRRAGANLIQALKDADKNFLLRVDKNFLLRVEMINYQSKEIRVKYEACLAQGFSEAQAIFLSTQHWT